MKLTMEKPMNVILDSDPGHDDAVAILLAGSSKKINLLGISVVSGKPNH
jgi:inosine-uridine nucleoside N-ribohydrolase